MRNSYLVDVQNYIDDNQHQPEVRGKVLEELTPEEFFKFWLTWQGFIGWSVPVLELLDQLGWKRPEEDSKVDLRK